MLLYRNLGGTTVVFRPDFFRDGFFIEFNFKINEAMKGRKMKEKLNQIREEALAAISEENADIEQIRIKYLGKKGELTGCCDRELRCDKKEGAESQALSALSSCWGISMLPMKL